MDAKNILKELEQASGIDYKDIPKDNKFKELGVDGGKARLGWFKLPSFESIKESLNSFSQLAQDKEEFIFIGMGGSVNGIKALISLTGTDSMHTLDSLDPAAIEAVLSKVKNLDKCLVCAISKSGTTKETQLIAQSLKSVYKKDWKDHFLWIADEPAFSKLDSLGWQGSNKITIQVDKRADIGGRFTSPNTLVFLVPLFLIKDRKIEEIESIWNDFIPQVDRIREKSCNYAEKFKDSSFDDFGIVVKEDFAGLIDNWIIQLFQESLGSKRDDYSPKTLVLGIKDKKRLEKFNLIEPDLDVSNNYIYMASLMYMLEVFVSVFAVLKDINFVNQPYVEIYKKELKSLEDKEIAAPDKVDIEGLLEKIKEIGVSDKSFIDVVFYFSGRLSLRDKVVQSLKEYLPQKHISLFEGSDWNHHSYQAAFKDTKTLFVVGVLEEYKKDARFLEDAQILKNIKTLRAIGFATYKTIKDKSLYISL